jgi:hypothetical protein
MPPQLRRAGMKYALVTLAMLAAGNAMAAYKSYGDVTPCHEVLNYQTSPTTHDAVDGLVAVAILVKTTSSVTRTEDGGINFTSALPTNDKVNEIIRSSDFPVIMGKVQKYCAKFPDENLARVMQGVLDDFFGIVGQR